ncbi:MAG: hypothetical protein ACOY3Z_02370 [Thermodesulfobacteriota bacterium]
MTGWPPGNAFGGETVSTTDTPALEVLKRHPASLRAENMQVSLLLRGMGRQAGVNIVVADTIQDTISLDMENLSLYDLFHVVMDAKQLRYFQKNNVIFVEKKADPQSDAQEFVTERLCAKFGSATAIVDQLTPLLTQQGSIVQTSRGNCIVVRDQAANFKRLRDLLTALDQPAPQVHIEARIVTISTEAKKRLGIIWGYNNYKDAAALANKINPITTASDLSVTDPSTSLAFGFIRQNVNLNLTLQAMQDDNLLNILSAPSVLVLDGNEAEIKQGKEIPYVTQTSTIVNTTFREANLGLKVKPSVLQDGLLSLKVDVTNDSVDPTTTSRGDLLINKQAITTNLLLEDQVTIVIGGIVQQTENNANSKIPGLGDIPLVGNLFKNSRKQNEQSELMVFIKPRIMPMSDAVKPARTEAPPRSAAPTDSTPSPPSVPETPAPQTGESSKQ